MSLIFMGLVAIFISVRHFEDLLLSRLNQEANQLMVDFNQDGIEELRHDIRERVILNQPDRMLYSIISLEGHIDFDSIEMSKVSKQKYFFDLLSDFKVVERDLGNGYKLIVAAKRDGLQSLFKALAAQFVLVVILALFIGLVGGYLLVRRYVLRLNEIQKVAKILTNGEISIRLPLSNKFDLLDEVTLVVNQMLDRIEDLIREAQRVSSHVAHELRTPLGHVRQKIETMMHTSSTERDEQQLKELMEEIDQLLQIFSAILRLSEVRSGVRKRQFIDFDVRDILVDIVETYSVIAEQSGHELITNLRTNFKVRGDKILFKQMIVNLIENAIQHTSSGTKIKVEMIDDGGAQILIQDDGGGVINIDKISDPFFSNHQSGRTGLGLALVSAIAKMHNFEISFTNNNGLIIQICLPEAKALALC